MAACGASDDDGGGGGQGGGSGGFMATGAMPGGGGGGGGGGMAGSGATGGGGGGGGLDNQVGADVFDAGSDPNRNMVTPGSICERLTTIQCAAEAFCCDAPGRTIGECRTTMMAGCTNELHLDAVAARPEVGFDAAHAMQAFTDFEQRASQCDPSIAGWGISMEGLAGMQKGTVGAGQSCKPDLLQLSDEVAQIAALASCNDTAQQGCYPRSTGSISTEWTCEPRQAAGGACFADTNCQAGLFCDNPDFLIDGSTCKARKADGAACVAGNQCASLTCMGGACVPADKQSAYCLK